MHTIHTQHRPKSKIKIVCDPRIILNSSVHDIQLFCKTTNTYIEINDGVDMLVLPESEEK